jgi:hypothetical protein
MVGGHSVLVQAERAMLAALRLVRPAVAAEHTDLQPSGGAHFARRTAIATRVRPTRLKPSVLPIIAV